MIKWRDKHMASTIIYSFNWLCITAQVCIHKHKRCCTHNLLRCSFICSLIYTIICRFYSCVDVLITCHNSKQVVLAECSTIKHLHHVAKTRYGTLKEQLWKCFHLIFHCNNNKCILFFMLNNFCACC